MSDGHPIRVGANAVIVSDAELLVVVFDDDTGIHYNVPGGGVHHGESIREGLIREVREETTAEISVNELLFAHEYVPDEQGGKYGPIHKLTLFFDCQLAEDSSPTMPPTPDSNQIAVDWLPLDDLEESPLLPNLGEKWLDVLESPRTECYFSD